MGQAIIFCPVASSFYPLLSFSSPNLSRRRLDVYHTSTHGVALVRIQNAGLKRAARARWKCRTQKIAIWSPSQNFVRLCLWNWGTYRQSEKNLFNNNVSFTCRHNMANFGPLAAETGWRVWGTPAQFNGFLVLAALPHGIVGLIGVSQTLRRWTEGAIYIGQGGHHVGHWPTF